MFVCVDTAVIVRTEGWSFGEGKRREEEEEEGGRGRNT